MAAEGTWLDRPDSSATALETTSTPPLSQGGDSPTEDKIPEGAGPTFKLDECIDWFYGS